MSTKTSLIVGGIGGALPALIELINTDAATMFQGFDFLVFAGHAVRIALLIILGVFLVWVNSETDLRKALQMGIMAPAIIVGLTNGAQLRDAKQELAIAKQQLQNRQLKGRQNLPLKNNNISHIKSGRTFWLVSYAYAEDGNTVPKGIHRNPTTFSKIWYGLTGQSDNGWFVIVGSHKTEKEAETQVASLKKKGYRAIVYPPFLGSSYYGVMIGSWLTLDEAKTLQSQAIRDGLPEDTYLWKFRP
jgi:hypothetical protein